MIVIIEKGGDTAKPLVEFSSFAKAAKWLVQCGSMFSEAEAFEIWSVWTFKSKPTEKILEAEFEVLS
jgi:hypothetical protein